MRGVDLKHNPWQGLRVDEFITGDLRNPAVVAQVIDQPFDKVYQLAADMGRAGYIFTGEHDADVMHNSAQINLNVAPRCVEIGVKKYSTRLQPAFTHSIITHPENPKTAEDSAYPAAPDSEYG